MHQPHLRLESLKIGGPLFDEKSVLDKLKHHLPSQAPLKDFIHHNSLHAFQSQSFHRAARNASAIFGYRTYLSVREFRQLYAQKRIRQDVLERVIVEAHGHELLALWLDRLLKSSYDSSIVPRVGRLRSLWKSAYHVDLDSLVHPKLFRILNSFLDQGVAIWHFPVWNLPFLESLRELEKKALVSLFESERARTLLRRGECTIESLLKILVGNEDLFNVYIFDQQFAHPGWSGMVSVVEDRPGTLVDRRIISLKDLITFELLLEIDALDTEFGDIWMPLGGKATAPLLDLFFDEEETELSEVNRLWQEAFEQSYTDDVLFGLSLSKPPTSKTVAPEFQAILCIDDRECSIRRHLETRIPGAQTYGTPGHFGIDAWFRPNGGKFVTKICPAPLTPKHVIQETDDGQGHAQDVSYGKTSHGLLSGFFFAQTIGFLSAIKLFINIFRPSVGAATTLSFNHMSPHSTLTVENNGDTKDEGLQVGFTVDEMADRVSAVLSSIGLVNAFAPIVYLVAHGSSSVNNTHFAGYDCGACSGRPGSVNARAFALMANHPAVRERLRHKGIVIPERTQFLGSLHDTSRDEVTFYDEQLLSEANQALHRKHASAFEQALQDNAHERSRRFELAPVTGQRERRHQHVKQRTVSLFEPRPELNHATNALAIIGSRELTRHLFLDRRAFLNSYDAAIDPDGRYLSGILNAVAPVCGGINLEYYFSRVDSERLGAGTKLPHNVMGLFGVANGLEGDLRTGLPTQMIEVHDPVRLLVVVEQAPDIVLKSIQANAATWEWFAKQWVNLAAIHPTTRQPWFFRDGAFLEYTPLQKRLPTIEDLDSVFDRATDNIPVSLLKSP